MKLDIVVHGKMSEIVIGELPDDQVRSLLMNPFDLYAPEAPAGNKWQELDTFYHNNGLLLDMNPEKVVVDIYHKDAVKYKQVEIPVSQMKIRDIELSFELTEGHSGVLCGSVKEGMLYFAIDDVPLDYDFSQLTLQADRIEGQGVLLYRVTCQQERSFQEEVSSGKHMIEPVFFK